MSIAKIRAALESRLLTVKGTATGFTTTNAGYALGAKVINLANVGTGIIYAGDIIKVNGDTNPYIVSVGGQANGSITLASGLLKAIPTSTTAITVQSFDTVWENTNYTPVTGLPFQRCFLKAYPENRSNCRYTKWNGMFYVRLDYPQGIGTKMMQDRAQLILNSFKRDNTTLVKDDLKVFISETPEFNTEGNDGDRFCGLVTVKFYTNEVE